MKKPLRTAGLVAGGAAGMILALAGCRAPRPGKVLESPYLPPRRHAWSSPSDELIWNTLLPVGRE